MGGAANLGRQGRALHFSVLFARTSMTLARTWGARGVERCLCIITSRVRFVWIIANLAALALPFHLRAGELARVPSRDGVTVGVFWEATAKPLGTVLLFPGGQGNIGRVVNGQPSSGNFLVRSHAEFLRAGYNVAIMGKPSNHEDLQFADRISDWHLRDIGAAIEFAKSKSAAPIWLIGTSRGSISVAHAAIHLRDERLAGIVLTASVVAYKFPGALPKQKLSEIKLPTLIVHHEKDDCGACRPHEVRPLLNQLTSAPRKALIMVEGGHSPTGDPCEAFHWHGFVNYERETIAMITRWMQQ